MSLRDLRPYTPAYRDERWRQFEMEQEKKRAYNMVLGGFVAGLFLLVLVVIGYFVLPHTWRRNAGYQVDDGVSKVERGIDKLKNK